MKVLVSLISVFVFSSPVFAEQKPAYKNLDYLSWESQRQACATVVAQPSRESIECLYFEHQIRSAREAGSGLAEGKRTSARLIVKPEIPGAAGRIAILVQNGQTDAAIRLWKDYVKRLARFNRPADVNEQIVWVAREAFIKNDPEFDHRLKSFASSVEAHGLAADRVADTEKSIQVCAQTPNCPVSELEETLESMKDALNSASSSNEMEMIKLQHAIAARAQLIQLISNMVNAFNETTKSIINNIGDGCSPEPCRKK